MAQGLLRLPVLHSATCMRIASISFHVAAVGLLFATTWSVGCKKDTAHSPKQMVTLQLYHLARFMRQEASVDKPLPSSGVENLEGWLTQKEREHGRIHFQVRLSRAGQLLHDVPQGFRLVDAWGQRLVYERRGDAFILGSTGPNGRWEQGSGDDIVVTGGTS